MPPLRSSRIVCSALIAALAVESVSLAQPAPAPPAAPGAKVEDARPNEAAKPQAQAHFEKGLKLLQDEAWAAALAEFLVSRELFPTRAATNNAAVALRKLQRFDEALDMFETLLRDFPTMPAEERAAAQRAAAELRGLVGTIEIVDAEPGAAIAIGGQNKGEYPPITPLRVAAGSHQVRVFKEGFEPFEARVDVAGGQTARVAAPLRRLTAAGRLKVLEQAGREIDVVIDNVVVGKTPWEGVVSIGAHTVLLRGKDKLGTQPASAPVKAGETTALTLRAEDLDAALRVDPSPPGASVIIDSVPVGRGAWFGRLRSGPHKIEIVQEGFVTVTRQIELEKGGRQIVGAKLERDPDAGIWRLPSKITFDLGGSLLVVPSFGGDVASGCSKGCTQPAGLGWLALLHASYELGSGFGFGLVGGYLSAAQDVTGRTAKIVPVNLPAQAGTSNDALHLRGALLGATVGVHFGDRVPVAFRLGAGALIGSMRDERTGKFKTTGGASYETFAVAAAPAARYFLLDPEARVGLRFAKHFEASIGVQALVLIAITQPKWDERVEVGASTDGIGTYPADTLSGSVVLMLAPGANLRYDF